MREAIALSRRGVTVDIDVVEQDLGRWLGFFLKEGGDPAFLTASSDSALSSPETLIAQIRSCILEHGIPHEVARALVTSNPARMLGLAAKARIERDADADLLLLDARSLDIRHVIAGGKQLVIDGQMVAREAFLKESNRHLELNGDK